MAVIFAAFFTAFVLAVLALLLEDAFSVGVLLVAVLTGSLALAAGLRIDALRGFVEPFRDHDFFWVFATRFLMQFGIFSIAPFLEFYFHDVVGSGDRSGFQSSLWLGVAILAGVAPAVICGGISDRISRRKIFVYASGTIQAAVAAVLLFGLVSNLPLLYILGVLFGVGYGTYYAVDWALACDVLPNGGATAGKDMALWHISFTLPQVLAPALLAAVLHYFNDAGHVVAGISTGNNLGYRIVFGAAALWFALGTIMVSRIKGVR